MPGKNERKPGIPKRKPTAAEKQKRLEVRARAKKAAEDAAAAEIALAEAEAAEAARLAAIVPEPKNYYAGELDEVTGRPLLIQDKFEARLKKAQLTNMLDLSCSTDANGFHFHFSSIPSEVYMTFHLSNLSQLWLTNNKISHITYEVRCLKNLKTLGIAGNLLTSLPADIGELPKLERLLAGGNQLATIPDSLRNLRKLKELRLDNNRITFVAPAVFDLLALVRLGLSGNRLSEIPVEIRRLTKLVELDLDNNQLTAVPPELARLKVTLRQLGLSSNMLAEEPDFLKGMSLDVLRLTGNREAGYEIKDPVTDEVMEGVNVPVRHDGYLQLKTKGNKHLEGHLLQAQDYNADAALVGTELHSELRGLLAARGKKKAWKVENRALNNSYM
jgi:hypothetical protein